MTFVCMEVQGGTIFNKNSFLILEFHNFSWRYYLWFIIYLFIYFFTIIGFSSLPFNQVSMCLNF